jgi:hypothetical protein
MASLRRFPGSRYWFACFIGPDGRRCQRSTKETDKGRAQKIADRYAEAARLDRMGLLADRQARKVIADISQISNRSVLRDETIRGYFNGWLERKEHETTNATFRGYSGVSLLCWQNVDLANREPRFTSEKPGREMVIPVASPLYSYLRQITKKDEPGAPLFPSAFELHSRKKSGLSNKFYRLITGAGVVAPRTTSALKLTCADEKVSAKPTLTAR